MSVPIAIFCDFDGTVTQEDVIDVLLTELADPRWRTIESAWARGLMGSRECLAQQIPLIHGGWAAVTRVLEHITLEPTFRSFATWCRANSIPLRIVSDGLDRVIHTLLDREGIIVDGVIANCLEESPSGELSITFPSTSEDSSCHAGLCKCQLLHQANSETLRIVIGDGRSDFCWARAADWVFAKSQLLTYCRLHHVPCRPFEDFDIVRRTLESLLMRFTSSQTSSPFVRR